MTAGGVLVWGSANMDVVVTLVRVPAVGETLLAHGLSNHPGGKGLNQAVAAARAGADVAFCAALGRDGHGDDLARLVDSAGMDTGLLRRVDGVATGTAYVYVQDDGDNAIVVVPGANAALTGPSSRERSAIADADVVVLSLEVPLAGIRDVVAAVRAADRPPVVVLNAAPALPLDAELLAGVDVLVVNEHEATLVAGHLDPSAGRDVDAAAAFLSGLVPTVVVTLGAEGAVVVTGRADDRTGRDPAVAPDPVRVPAPRVTAVDTTAAGDTFTGYLAASLAGGAAMVDAVHRAVRAGSLAVQKAGATTSIPFAAELGR